MYLCNFTPLVAEVGYGGLGVNGELGYENLRVSVGGKSYEHALSTHGPARLLFELDGRYASFSCQVALNDDVPAGASNATFAVVADGRPLASEPFVWAGTLPRTISVNIDGARNLELLVQTRRWEYCHAVWLDPQLSETPVEKVESTLLDCLGRAEIELPSVVPRAERCIATVGSPGFERLLDDMLGSLAANGACDDALRVVFLLNTSEECERVASKYQATVVRCRSRAPVNAMSKALLYSVARVVDAEQFICMDADMLVLGSLRPIFSALEVLPPERILVCLEGNSHPFKDVGDAFFRNYQGSSSEFERMGITPDEAAYSLVINDGIFAGSRSALMAVDGVIRSMPHAVSWTDGSRRCWWRNQFVFNLALARLRCGVELDSTYNVQLHVQNVSLSQQGSRIAADWRGQRVRVLHFCGGAKRKYPQWQGLFASVPDPLIGTDGDGYARFLHALRAWVGRRGTSGLAWSFYGTTNGTGARVRDPSTFPLLAALHYLVRSNGCVRVMETGTARGIATACIASAVAHREGGRVVTFDICSFPEREELWASLPEEIRDCVEARDVDSLEGMTEALKAGERYEAALLDSLHTEEQVWAEFQLASQLVCPGGLILVHDPVYEHGTVGAALRRIRAEGYGVTRLWTAEGGVAEDDHLGLALIENRRYEDD